MISSGSSAIARASAMRRAMPPDTSAMRSGAAPRRPTALSFISTMSRIMRSGRSVCSRSGKATLSNTVRSVNSAPNWNSMPRRRRSRYSCVAVARRRRARRRSSTWPCVAGWTPPIRRSSVVLPQPEPPRMAVTLPRAKRSDTSFRIVRGWRRSRSVTWSISIRVSEFKRVRAPATGARDGAEGTAHARCARHGRRPAAVSHAVCEAVCPRGCAARRATAALSAAGRCAHQELVDRARGLAALADRPDDQRLAAAHVAGGEDLVDVGLVAAASPRCGALALPRASRSTPKASSTDGHRADEAHRQQHQVGLGSPSRCPAPRPSCRPATRRAPSSAP